MKIHKFVQNVFSFFCQTNVKSNASVNENESRQNNNKLDTKKRSKNMTKNQIIHEKSNNKKQIGDKVPYLKYHHRTQKDTEREIRFGCVIYHEPS